MNLYKGQNEVFTLLDVGCNEGDLSLELLQLARQQLPNHVRCLLIGTKLQCYSQSTYYVLRTFLYYSFECTDLLRCNILILFYGSGCLVQEST